MRDLAASHRLHNHVLPHDTAPARALEKGTYTGVGNFMSDAIGCLCVCVSVCLYVGHSL